MPGASCRHRLERAGSPGEEGYDVRVEVIDGVVREGDLDESLMLGSVIADGEPERFEQSSELFGESIYEVHAEHR